MHTRFEGARGQNWALDKHRFKVRKTKEKGRLGYTYCSAEGIGPI
jgi:hypothetical protein